MFLEGVLIDVESKLLIQILEEYATHIVALRDDDGIFLAQLIEVGKGWSKHRVCRHVWMARLLIKLFEIGLYRTDVADDAVVGKIWQHLFECRDGVFHRHGIDDELWFELLDFVDLGEALTIVSEA